ncbi:MAG: type VI secretion system contractile sheath large subunit, partial [Pseudomonadota bacterium]
TFAALRSTRRRLMDPATFEEALRELNLDTADDSDDGEPAPDAPEAAGTAFEQLLGGAPANPAATTARATTRTVESIVSSLVAPFVEPGTDPRQDEYAAMVDSAISELMRTLLHDPAFQRLEARWRSVHELITSVETGEELKVYLLDVTREELQDDLCAPGVTPDQTGLYRQLVEKNRQTAGGDPWTVLVADWNFGASGDDIGLLAALGALGAQAGGPVLAGANTSLFGCTDVWSNPDVRAWSEPDAEEQAVWNALRQSPMATWIGLSAPRLLSRVPYGAKRDEIDAFSFEETPDDADGSQYLWSNPAFALAALLGQDFTERGWQLVPGQSLDVQDLPACSVKRDGEAMLVPCGEAFLSEPAAAAISAQGVMPVLSHASANRVRFAGVHSIASPQAPLSGAWNS